MLYCISVYQNSNISNLIYSNLILLEAAIKYVGLFSSPLETALLREQVLDRQGKLIKKKKSVAHAKNVENFTVLEWSTILELSNHIQYFIRE